MEGNSLFSQFELLIKGVFTYANPVSCIYSYQQNKNVCICKPETSKQKPSEPQAYYIIKIDLLVVIKGSETVSI